MTSDAGGGPPPGDAPAGGTDAARQDHVTRVERQTEPGHWRRLVPIWVAVSVVADVLYYALAGPHIPPGRMTSTANGAVFDWNILFVVALPVVFAVWIYMIYAIVMWRSGRVTEEPFNPPERRSHLGFQMGWIVVTSLIVLFAAAFGTYVLVQPEGSGGGQGPAPIWTPTSDTVLPIQVIGQQWKWTYRYPTFGGFETTSLVIPDDTTVAFHVTSLDVVHDFWAYQLGVKADANPQQDNVAFTTPQQLGSFVVRCAELCGIWHGAMYNYGRVMTKGAFMSWATTTRRQLAPLTRTLPPFAWTYTPDANGADGGYYPDNVDPYSKIETYGAVPSPTPRTKY